MGKRVSVCVKTTNPNKSRYARLLRGSGSPPDPPRGAPKRDSFLRANFFGFGFVDSVPLGEVQDSTVQESRGNMEKEIMSVGTWVMPD